MDIKTIPLHSLFCADVNSMLKRLFAKRGFDNPYGTLHAAKLTYALYCHQFPLVDRQDEIAVVFEVPGAHKSKQLAAAWSTMTAMHYGLGQPFGIEEEGDDLDVKPFLEVCPRPGAPENSNASTGEFRFHTDNAALSEVFRPEWISLACLNNDAKAATGIVRAETISEHLHPVLREAARASRFVCATPPSFGVQAYAESETRPIMFDGFDGVEIAFSTYRTRGADADDEVASETLREIERLANEKAAWVTLEPGQILHFDNARAMHARKPIVGERLLLRAYWRRDIRELDRHAATDLAHIYSARRAMKNTGGAQ